MGWYLAECSFKRINKHHIMEDAYRFLVRNIDVDDPAFEMRCSLEKQIDETETVIGNAEIVVTGPYQNAEEALENANDPTIKRGEE